MAEVQIAAMIWIKWPVPVVCACVCFTHAGVHFNSVSMVSSTELVMAPEADPDTRERLETFNQKQRTVHKETLQSKQRYPKNVKYTGTKYRNTGTVTYKTKARKCKMIYQSRMGKHRLCKSSPKIGLRTETKHSWENLDIWTRVIKASVVSSAEGNLGSVCPSWKIYHSENCSVTIRGRQTSYNVEGDVRPGRWGTGKRCNDPARGAFEDLFWEHTGKAVIYSVTSFFMVGHQKCSQIQIIVLQTPG